MAEEDFKEGFIKFGNSAVYFILDKSTKTG
jgi:hypothetical protein